MPITKEFLQPRDDAPSRNPLEDWAEMILYLLDTNIVSSTCAAVRPPWKKK